MFFPLFAVFVLFARSTYSYGFEETRCVPKRYNTTAARSERKINVHLIPHTHDDTGWLKTVDQYYYGARQDIQVAGVQYVIDTVIYALLANPDRKFAYAEMSFFTRWWAEQPEETQEAVKKLVEEGRLSFMNGGWVQHDEAAAHYVAMIDQTTRGHRFLNETFGFRPRVGWQIDPFGHSNTQASLMAGFLGFDGMFFGRSDYQDLDRRKNTKELEMLWRGAKSFGKDADVFLGTFPSGNYGPPGGFYFDWGNQDPQIQDSVCLTENNLEERVDAFVKAARDMADMYEDDDVFWPMGTDFTYSNAFTWYKNMDKLIHYVNLDGRVNALYSTPEEYVDAKNSFNHTWPLKTDDFFPYADCPTCYWTGYFVSRAASKGYIRQATSYLQVARQLEVATRSGGHSDSLEEAVALLQHHDAITGTEKQHVANDYHKRLAKGWLTAERFINKALSHLVYSKPTQEGLPARTLPEAAERELRREAMEPASASEEDALLTLQQCPLLNVSACERSVKLSQKAEPFLVVAYNPLAWPRTAAIRVPVESNHSTSWSVKDSEGGHVASQLVPVNEATRRLQKLMHEAGSLPSLKHTANDELVFQGELPPLGYATFFVGHSRGKEEDGLASASTVREWSKDAQVDDKENPLVLGNGIVNFTLDAETGAIQAFRTRSGKEIKLGVQGGWYNSSDADGPGGNGPPSGAYIFRPNGYHGPRKEHNLASVTVHGPVLTEIRQTLLDYLTVVTRIWKGHEHAEVEWTAGPIPIDDGFGKEIVIRYQTNLSTGSTFYTDSNGREMQQRKLDHRDTWKLKVTEKVSGNYYPLTAAIAIKDEDAEVAVLVDRGQGGTSLRSGEVEVMLHRRTLLDDWRGVAEPLNETEGSCRACNSPGLVVRGNHLFAVEESHAASAQRRHLQQLLNDPVVLAFGPVPLPPSGEVAPAVNGRLSAMDPTPGALPPNVHLLTSKLLEDGSFLIRLAHLFQVDEDAGSLAKSAKVDLNSLFRDLSFESVKELGLGGAQPLDEIHRHSWRAGHLIHGGGEDNPIDFKKAEALQCASDCATGNLEVEIQPMEIRTFLATAAQASHSSESISTS